MVDLFGGETPTPEEKHISRKTNWRAVEGYNTLVVRHGVAEGKRCKDCKHFWQRVESATYFRCFLLFPPPWKATPSKDHRANWVACGKFEQNDN